MIKKDCYIYWTRYYGLSRSGDKNNLQLSKQLPQGHKRTPNNLIPAARTHSGPARMNQTSRAARGFEDLQRTRTHGSEGNRMMVNAIEPEYIALMRAVIVQAARDAAAGDVGAAAWLASDETADTWLMIAGVRRSAVLSWLQLPAIRKGVRKGSATRPAKNKRRKNNQRILAAA